jgi:tellurite resistance protein TerB
MLGFLKSKIGEARNLAAYGTNKDFLEAVCASIALVAAADGNIADDEVAEAMRVAKGNKTLSTAFGARDIETTLDTMLNRAKGASGRMSLARELEDIKSKDATGTMAEDVYLAALDVAAADGDIGAKEQEALNKIAGRLGIDPKKFEF